jgi:TPR repeat protein
MLGNLLFYVSKFKALTRHKTSAQQEYAKEQLNLALMYKNGSGVKKNEAKAVEWYTQAAEGGNVEAQLNMAVMSEDGHGMKKNEVEAVRWYSMAAKRGNEDGQYNLDWYIDNRPEVYQKFLEAVTDVTH